MRRARNALRKGLVITMRPSLRSHARSHTRSHIMPPPPRRELRKLVRKLGVAARPAEQKAALSTLLQLCRDPDSRTAVVSAGATPGLVHLLGPGFAADVHLDATMALVHLADSTSEVAITTAGAIPPLVQLLGSGSSAHAAAALMSLAVNADCKTTIAAAGAVPSLVQLLGGAGSQTLTTRYSAGALSNLANGTDNVAVAITAAGAVPALRQLLLSSSDADTKQYASRTLVGLRISGAVIDTAEANAEVQGAMGALRI
jgi:hypothetical protein